MPDLRVSYEVADHETRTPFRKQFLGMHPLSDQ